MGTGQQKHLLTETLQKVRYNVLLYAQMQSRVKVAQESSQNVAFWNPQLKYVVLMARLLLPWFTVGLCCGA